VDLQLLIQVLPLVLISDPLILLLLPRSFLSLPLDLLPSFPGQLLLSSELLSGFLSFFSKAAFLLEL